LGPNDCSFEEDTGCSWSETQTNDQFDWESIQPEYQGLDLYSPPQDHTLGTEDGNLLHIPISQVHGQNDTGFLTSPVISQSDALYGNCLTFWYWLYGPSVDGIQVYRIVGNQKTLLWQRTSTQGPYWRKAQIETVDISNYQLQIVGLRGLTYLGSTCIDDIQLATYVCPSNNFSVNNDCDFEHGMCGFTHSTQGSSWFLWLLQSSSTGTQGTGPTNDHSYGTPIGHYVYMEATTRAPSSKTSIISPNLSLNVTNVCLKFWYSMYGDTMGELSVYRLSNGSRQQVWHRAGNQGSQWLMAEVSVAGAMNSIIKLEFEGVVGSSDLSDIALDDLSLRIGGCENNDACDFEQGFCTWANTKYSDKFDWLIGFGATPSFNTGPTADHTIGNGTGHYAFIEASAPQKYSDSAHLVSQIFDSSHAKCLHFYYNMNGQNIGTLSVYMNTTNGKVTRLWTLSGPQGTQWKSATVYINSSVPYQIIIEGTVGYDYDGDIAIDDISFTSDVCAVNPSSAVPIYSAVTTTVSTVTTQQQSTSIPTPYDCNFEVDYCGWTQDVSDNFNWTRAQGPAGLKLAGPLVDHTLGNDQGWYSFIEESSELNENDTARLISPTINTGQRCLRFYFTMFGTNVFLLNAYIRQNSQMTRIFSSMGDKGEAWMTVSIPINPSGAYQLVLEGVRGRWAGGDIAVDDITVPIGPCPEKSLESGAVSCTFENQPVDNLLCGYTQERDDNFDWSLNSNGTINQNTGPYTDHTYGSFTGHYIYAKGSSPQKANDTARIRSPTYAPGMSQQHCLTFFYQMYGADIGTLNVYQVASGKSILGNVPIWSKSYDMGPGWRKAEVTLSLSGNYQLLFEGIVGDGDRSSIALDDIKVTNGFCPNSRACSFTTDTCLWRSLHGGGEKFTWLWSKGETAPITDHTSGTSSGYYMYIDYKDRQFGDRARLASQMFPPTPNQDNCFSFWYFIYGANIGALKAMVVYNASYDVISSEATLWQLSNQTNSQWMSAQVNISSFYTKKPFMVVLEGITGNGPGGIIAVDDTNIEQFTCQTVPAEALPVSDELKVADCNFDVGYSFCNWDEFNDRILNWFVTDPNGSPNVGPVADHTGHGGRYLYVDPSDNQEGAAAILFSPVLPPTNGLACFSLWYHMYGENIGQLQLLTNVGDVTSVLWQREGNQADKWLPAAITIESKTNYQIFIKAIRGSGFVGDISIDDLLLTHNACPHKALCDFEVDMCGYSQETNDDFNWIRTQNIAMPTGASPTTDHTMNSQAGYFAFIDSSPPRKFGDRARIVSPVYPGGGAQCLQFYYYMNGAGMGSLFIYLRKTGHVDQDNLIWTMHASRGDHWVKGQATIDYPNIFQVVFDGTVGDNFTSNIALDDIQLLFSPCSSPVTCDFESGFCTFTNRRDDDYDWLLVTPSNTTFTSLVPSVDHTTGSAQGYFAMADIPDSPTGFKHSLLVSSDLQSPTTGQCLSLAYYIQGNGSLLIYLEKYVQNETLLILSNANGVDQSFHWKFTSMDVTSDSSFYIAFEAQREAAGETTIVLDDVALADGLCSLQTSPLPATSPTPPMLLDVLTCDFEEAQPLCNYTQNVDDDFDWLISVGSTSSDGPEADHTLGNTKGHYIHIDASAKSNNAAARISSAQFRNTNSRCLSFWYHMHGADINRLNVYLTTSTGLGPAIWTKQGEQGLNWLNALVELGGDDGYHKIVFEGLASGGSSGDTALDDITVYDGPCPTPAFCDFEDDGVCRFDQDIYDDFDWLRHNGSTSTGPNVDHTYGTKYGHYMYIETSNPRVPGDVARMLTPVYPATDGRCLKYWYHMYGSSMGTLAVYLRDVRGNDLLLDNKVGNFGNQWLLAQVDLISLTPFQVVFEGTVGRNNSGDIALDDVEVSKEACVHMYGCDFERGLCSWIQNKSDNLDWIINHGPTATMATGPAQDHTISSLAGQYIYLESSPPSKPGDVAVLDSQMIPVKADNDMFCFSLWYFMYGTNIGYLNVTVKTIDDTSAQTIYFLFGPQGQSWKQALINIPKPSNTFQISVIGSVGSGYLSDIALDDFLLNPGSCQDNSLLKGNFSCGGARNQTIPYSKVCDFVRDCTDTAADEGECGDCSFQYDWCRYIDTSVGDQRWSRGFNGSLTSNTGPTYDPFNDSSGYYIYVAKAQGTKSDMAEIQTNFNFGPSSASCQMKFFYHMFGSGIGRLMVVLRESQEDTIVFEKVGDQGNRWIKALVDIGRVASHFKVVFRATRLFSVNGDIAIDDITFINCEYPAPQASCPAGQFTCQRKACIDYSHVCDFSDDCGDGSDEQNCAAYPLLTDFEYSYGAWIQDKTDSFDWIRRQGATGTSDAGPTRDHTRGTVRGHYAYFDTSSPKVTGQRARLLSPLVSATSNKKRSTSSCQIRFFYHMYGSSIGQLNIYTRTNTNGPLKTMFTRSLNQGDRWIRQDLPLAETADFQIIIEAVVGVSYFGGIAVDDISLTDGCKLSVNNILPTGLPPSSTSLSPCGSNFRCGDGQCIPQSSVCNYVLDCIDASDEVNCGNCNFESNLCGWTDNSVGIFRWMNVSVSAVTGLLPNSDTTFPATNQGHYVAVRPGPGLTVTGALLISPQLKATGPDCRITFNYYMNGDGSGNLAILLQNSIYTATNRATTLWTVNSLSSSSWTTYSVDIGQVPNGYQVLIQSTPVNGYSYAVAIDDIKFLGCQLNTTFNLKPTVLDCTFTGGDFCGYFESRTDDFDWTLTNHATPSLNTGPSGDHTTGHDYYIYIESSSPQKFGDRAVLISALMAPTSIHMCLKFWYHMFGADIDTLNVYLINGANYSRIWTRSGSHGNVWRQGEAPVFSTQNYQISFEGTVGHGYGGDIALDDISLINGSCSPQDMCDFEIDLCEYTQIEFKDVFDWTRWANKTASNGTGPATDHTTNNGYGNYLHIGPLGRTSGDNAQLLGPEIAAYGLSHCVYFWFHMYGANIGTLNVIARTQFKDVTIWTRSGQLGDFWSQGRATIDGSLGTFHVIFEGVIGTGYQGDIGLDDIRLVDGACPHIGSCDFEYDMCGMYNSYGNDKFDWLRNAGSTSTSNTGPPADHTTNSGQGYYMYTESSNQRLGDKAWLITDIIPATRASCLTFWYYMYGSDVGTLRVYLSQSNNVSSALSIWQLTGNQGAEWKPVQLALSSPVDYQIIFVGEQGSGYLGDIAIDDLLISDGPCVNLTTPSPTDVTGASAVTNAPSQWDCNFDANNICSWHQDTTDKFDWTVHKGMTDSYNTGPNGDHTSGQGYYIYTESSGRQTNDTARIYSDVITLQPAGLCVRFWYNMYGSDSGTLNLYAKQDGELGPVLWKRVGEQGQSWKLGFVHILEYGGQIQLVFEGVLTAGYMGDMALDDITVTDGYCIEYGGQCDFESYDLCGYTQDSTDDFDWIRTQGPTPDNNTGPTQDHTYGTPLGFYLYTSSAPPHNRGEKARLISPTMMPTSAQCLTFYYNMFGQTMGTLNIYLKSLSGLSSLVWSTSGQLLIDWLPAQVTLSNPVNFQLVFEGVLGGLTSDMAIDDISFKPGPCKPAATCDFEDGPCLFFNTPTGDDFDWEIHTGFDHTLQTQNGHVMMLDGTKKTMGQKARLLSQVLPPTPASCFSFYSKLNQINGGTLVVYVDTNISGSSNYQNLYTLTAPPNPDWRLAQINISSTNPYMILIEGRIADPLQSTMYIDDVTLKDGHCVKAPENFACADGTHIQTNRVCDFHHDCNNNTDESHCGTCTFESDLCGFVDLSKGSFVWRQATDADATDVVDRIGADHTTSTTNGHFLYVTGQRGLTNTDATLISPLLQPTFGTCQFQFFYKRYDAKLQVYVQVGARENLLWETTDVVTGPRWAKALVSIGRYNTPIQVVIKATRSYSSPRTLAIDDTSFLNCAKPTPGTCSTQFRCLNQVCIDPIYKCDLNDDCGDASDESTSLCSSANQCTFESGLCSWTQDTQDDLNWQIHQGPTSTPSTGPSVDHTTGLDTGHFIYLETSSPSKQGQKARLLSPVISATSLSSGCHLSFFYHMYGDTMGFFNIYILTEKGGYPTLLFSRQNRQQNYWARDIIPLNNTKNFQVLIEGVVGKGNTGDMAVDDITLSSGCHLNPTGTTLPNPSYVVTTPTTIRPTCPYSFACGSSECVPLVKVCDFVANCKDGSDEALCGPCNFESGLCGWSYASTGHFKWSLSTQTVMGKVGPALDSTNSSSGHYMYIQPDFGVTPSPAVLRSPYLGAISTACVMNFNYHLPNTANGNLSVVLVYQGVRNTIWTATRASTNWMRSFIYIGRFAGQLIPKGTQIEIVYQPRGTYSPTIDIAAVDNITFAMCNPNQVVPSLACSFETRNLCAWSQSNDDQFDWTLFNGTTATYGTGPRAAHTGRWYIYAEASSPQKANDTTLLKSPTLSPTTLQGFCLTFWYHMHGSDMGSLALLVKHPFTSFDTLWSISGTQRDDWIQQNVYINMSREYTLYFKATIGKGFESDIAIDDISVSAGQCPALAQCTFDSGFCDFTQETNDKFDWSLGSGSTATFGTGPSKDHTLGSSLGKYAYIEASGQMTGNNAILNSGTYLGFQYSRLGCLTFWYHMYGNGIGTLNVYRKDQGNSSTVNIWTLSGPQENMWKKATVSIRAQGNPYQIQFEGIVGTDLGDIAIDDVLIRPGMCPPIASCTFERDLCSYINLQGDNFDWIQDSAGTDSANTGPQVDHTTGTTRGQYIYIETSGNYKLGDSALLQSEPVPASNSSCLDFWYHMYGAGIGQLNVYTKPSSAPSRTLIWTLSNNQGNLWQHAIVPLSYSYMFEIIFEGTYGGNYTGDIALDDISYHNSPCSGVTASPITPTLPSFVTYSKSPLDCDFETFCGWTQDDDGDDINWILNTLVTTIKGNGPRSDHTVGNSLGHYRHTEVQANAKARFISPTFTIPANGSICFRLFYYMYGATINRLSIYVSTVNPSTELMIWTRTGTQGPEWKLAQIHVQNMTGSVFLIVEGLTGLGDEVISIDDLMMNTGNCPPHPECDFEDGVCGYQHIQTNDFDWTLNSATTSTTNTGPQTDHTFGTNEGHYAYIESSSPRLQGDKARLQTQLFDSTSGSCLYFWISMFGETMGTLNVYQQDEGVPDSAATLIWTKSGQQGPNWQLGQVTLANPRRFYIIFEGVVGNGIYSDLAIDDISMKSGLCPGIGNCDFEGDICSWINTQTGDVFDWMRARGSRNYGTVGPRVDHTLRTEFGGYLVMDSNAPRKQGDTALLYSPVLQNGTSYCLNFWYMMNNNGDGTLNVNIKSYPQEQRRNIYHLQGNQGADWKSLRITIANVSTIFVIEFEGILGQVGYSDIAIDDIALQYASCESLPQPQQADNAFQCTKDNKWLSLNKVCDFKPDCSDGEEELQCGYNCNFDNTTCNWNNTMGSTYIWTKNQGATPTANTGPSVDHTLGTINGSYMYVSAGNGYSYATASFQSPVLQRAAPTCELVFYFHMWGTSIGTLSVQRISGLQTSTVFTTSRDYGNNWQQSVVPLGKSETPFTVAILAQRSYSTRGDIAIDDITFRNCAFPTPISSCTGKNTFKCNNSACIDPVLLCNLEDNCGDNSDEDPALCKAYDKCTFEIDLCDWSQELFDDNFDWTRRNMGTMSTLSGPQADHTTSLKSGYFLYIETSSPRLPGDKAWLLSPILKPTTTCQLSLYVFMYGKDIDTFSVYTRTATNGPLTVQKTLKGEAGNFWQQWIVPISSNATFQIVLEAIRGYGNLGDIAIDDVVLLPGCVASTDNLPVVDLVTTTTAPNPCGDSNMWQCKDKKQCIYSINVCDFAYDCNDQSDEQDCGACTFETSTCGWHDMSRSSYIWDRVNTSSRVVVAKPANDHTLGIQGIGWYMVIHPTDIGYARMSILESPLYGATEANCEIQFYYFNDGSGRVYLYLYPDEVTEYDAADQGIRLWTGYSMNSWQMGKVSIGYRAPGFRLIFRYEYVSPLKTNGMALDDITFSKGCQRGTPSSSCPAMDFLCPSSNECKPYDDVCDIAHDCQNGDDEDDLLCKNYYMCNFESGTCGFVQDDTDNFDWTLNQGRTSTSNTGPDNDHTFGTALGHYMYIESSSPRLPNDTARLKSPVFLPNPQGNCYMRMFYHMRGQHINALNVYTETREGGPLTLKWSKQGPQGALWLKAIIKLDDVQTFRVVIEGVRGVSFDGDIAIDDITFTSDCVKLDTVTIPPVRPTVNPGICKAGLEFQCDGQCKSLSLLCNFHQDCTDNTDEVNCPAVCDFETNMCGWGASGSVGTWTIKQASTYPGQVDIAPGNSNGHFLTSTDRLGVLLSPFFSGAGELCSFSFSFKTNHYPTTLSLSIRAGGFDNQLWGYSTYGTTFSNYNLNSWQNVSVQLPICSSDFQMVIAETFSSSYGSTILFLDNLAFGDCETPVLSMCEPGEFRCTSGQCIPKDQICDLETDCCDSSDEDSIKCYYYSKNTFEGGLGDWKMTTDSQGWTIQQGYAMTGSYPSMPRPFQDHTTKSQYGHYLYTGYDYTMSNAKAGISYILPASNGECDISFWYYISYLDAGNITVLKDTAAQGLSLVATILPPYTDYWIKASLQIKGTDPFQFIIKANHGVNPKGYFAIDDVVFSPGCNVPVIATPPPPLTTLTTPTTSPRSTFKPCGPNEFRCATSNICIAQSKVCDFQVDCLDQSDENKCSTLGCDFQTDLCSWYEVKPDTLDWQQGSSKSNPPAKGPTYDGTQLNGGGYAYLNDTNNGQTRGQTGALSSQIFSSSGAGCSLQFSYYLSGSNAGSLCLILNTTNQPLAALWQTSHSLGQWTSIIVGIGRRTSPFSLTFTRAPSDSFSGQMAIDQFEFIHCSLPLPQSSCAQHQFRCSNRACIDDSYLCDQEDDCGDNSDETSCSHFFTTDFENSLGNFVQLSEDQLHWQSWDSSQIPPETLPGVDHSTGLSTGHYMFVKGSSNTKGTDAGTLLSKTLAPTNDTFCKIRFYAVIPQGTQIKVSFRTHSDGLPDGSLNMKDPYPGTYWQHMVASITSDKPFQLMFQGMPGSPSGALAIDDVVFDSGCKFIDAPLPKWPTKPPLCNASIQYQCMSDQKCIDISHKCDGTIDCSDSSDEKQCPCTIHCENGGSCLIDSTGLRHCQCVHNFHGDFCQLSSSVTEQTTASSTTSVTKPSASSVGASSTPVHGVTAKSTHTNDSWKQTVGIVLGVIAAVILIVLLLVFLKKTNRLSSIPFRRFFRFGQSSEHSEVEGFSNSVYDDAGGDMMTGLKDL
ncbi:MAM and LDL-receptor class A domain-containing protein 2, partial [Biomphalaria glabrata]